MVLTEHSGEEVQNLYKSERAFARIVYSHDGGPIRRIISGRSRHSTGAFVSVKAGSRSMPWESQRCELPCLQLCEIASPVVKLLAQPHRLEMHVNSQTRPLIYFPDLLLTVEPSLLPALNSGVPFGKTLMDWTPPEHQANWCRQIVVEIKDDSDKRNVDREYQRKLELAKEVYRRMGMDFRIVIRSRDLECINLGHVRTMALDRFTTTTAIDIASVLSLFQSTGTVIPLGYVAAALGGGTIGRAKACALHVRRFVTIGWKGGLCASSPVRLMNTRFVWAGAEV